MFLAELAYPVTVAPTLLAMTFKATNGKKTSLKALTLSNLAFLTIVASTISKIPRVYTASPLLRKWISARTLQGFYTLMIVAPGLLIQTLASYILFKNNQDTNLLTTMVSRYNALQNRHFKTELSFKEWATIIFKTVIAPTSAKNLRTLAFPQILSAFLKDDADTTTIQLATLFEQRKAKFVEDNNTQFAFQVPLRGSENTELNKNLIRVILAEVVLSFFCNGTIIDNTQVELFGCRYNFKKFAFDTKFFAEDISESDMRKLSGTKFKASFRTITPIQLQYLVLNIKKELFSEESFTEKEKQAHLVITNWMKQKRIQAFHDTWEKVWYG